MSEFIGIMIREMDKKYFKIGLQHVLLSEGGYVNDPDDTGGETNYGVTIGTARNYGYEGKMVDIPKEIVEDIYRENYWIYFKCDKLVPYSPHLAIKTFDTCVNTGNNGVKILQRTINLNYNETQENPNLTVDGFIGNKTLEMLKLVLNYEDMNDKKLFETYISFQKKYYDLIIKNSDLNSEGKPRKEKYRNGWNNRAEAFKYNKSL